jgi:hypothetical protein
MLADAFQVGLTKPMPSPLRVDRARHETVNGEWSLEEACDRFIAAHVNGAWTAKTETQHRSTLDMFKRWARPGRPLSEIDWRVVGDFKALIEFLAKGRSVHLSRRQRWDFRPSGACARLAENIFPISLARAQALRSTASRPRQVAARSWLAVN